MGDKVKRVWTDAQRARISSVHKGKVTSAETRKKISETKLAKAAPEGRIRCPICKTLLRSGRDLTPNEYAGPGCPNDGGSSK